MPRMGEPRESWLAHGDRTQRVETYAPADEPPSGAVVFLDGEIFRDRVLAPDVVRALYGQRVIPPALSVYVSHGGADARHTDYVCDAVFAHLIADGLVGRIRDEAPTVCEFVLVGLSLSGLMAAYIATRHPETFRAVICQSPSFWWEGGRFAAELPAAAKSGPEFWISVGSQETEVGVSHPPSGMRQDLTQIAGCCSAVAALREKGYGVRYGEYDGGHAPECWREDLALALPWAWRRINTT